MNHKTLSKDEFLWLHLTRDKPVSDAIVLERRHVDY